MDKAKIREEGETFDTIVVPAHNKGFNDVFIGEAKWPNLKIDKIKKDRVRYIAVYQTKPTSAITHYAEVSKFVPLEKNGRYDVLLKKNAVKIEAVPFTHEDVCAIQGPRYTTLKRILAAKHLDSAFPAFG